MIFQRLGYHWPLLSPNEGTRGEATGNEQHQGNDSFVEDEQEDDSLDAESAQAGATAGDEVVTPELMAKLRSELQSTQAKLAESNDKMLRIAADFDNSRKRWERERGEVRQYSIQEFARDLLPVIDAFDKAMSAIEGSAIQFDTEEGKKMAAIVEGVQLVSKVFQDSVKKHGIERVPGKGQPFNPMFHNAVAKVVDDSVAQEMVADEFVPGYRIGDRVLRTAMVRVAAPD